MKNKNKFKGSTKVLGDTKKYILLPETKIGESLVVGCEMERDEIGLFIASLDVSASCAFKVKEWTKFVKAVNTANASLELAQGLER